MEKFFCKGMALLLTFVMVLGVGIIANPLVAVASVSCPCGNVGGIHLSGTRDITIHWSGSADIFALNNFRDNNPALDPEGILGLGITVSGHHNVSVSGQNSRFIPFENVLFNDGRDGFREWNNYRVAIRCSTGCGWAYLIFTHFRNSTFTISASPNAPSFGSLQAGHTQPAAQTVTISNVGNENITLNALPNVPNWTLAAAANWTTAMGPGATRTFTVRPNAGLAAGNHAPTINITGSGGASATIQPTFTVVAAPVAAVVGITATPSAPDFGSLPVGYAQPPAQTITITNTGNSNIAMGMATLPSVPNWTLEPGESWPRGLPPGGTRTFTIRPNAGLPAGTYTATITIYTMGFDGSGDATATIQPTFTVTQAIPTELAAPRISLTNSTLSWSAVPNAEIYGIFIDGEPAALVTGDHSILQIDLLEEFEFEPGSYTIQVVAINDTDDIVSEPSNSVTFTIADVRVAIGNITVRPSSVELGESVTVSVTGIANAYRLEIFTRVGTRETRIHTVQNPGASLTHEFIPANANINSILVRAFGEGDTQAERNTRITINETETDTDPAVFGSDALDLITDIESAVQVTQEVFENMDSDELEMGLIELFAENSIARAASVNVNGNIVINQANVSDLQSTAVNTRTAVEQMLRAEGHELQRELNAGISFVSDNYERVEIRVEPSAAQTQVNEIRIRTEHYEFTMPPVFMDSDIPQAPLSVTITRNVNSPRAYTVSFDRTPDTAARLAVTPNPGDRSNQAVRDSNGDIRPGRYNQATGKIEARIREGGTFTVVENRVDFTDIQHLSGEMQRAIRTLSTQGIVSGVGNDRFAPDSTITRAQFARLVTGMLAIYDSNTNGGFVDVQRTDWFFGAAGSANRHGLMTGTGSNRFSPNVTIPRVQLVAVSARVLQREMGYITPANPQTHLQRFNDRNTLPDWSVGDISLAARHNLDVRRADGRFAPNEPMTRGDAAIMLYRLYTRLF